MEEIFEAAVPASLFVCQTVAHFMMRDHLLAVSVGNVEHHRLDVCELCEGNRSQVVLLGMYYTKQSQYFCHRVLLLIVYYKHISVSSFIVLFANAFFVFVFTVNLFDINELKEMLNENLNTV